MALEQSDRTPKPGETYSIHTALLFTSAQACEAARIEQKTFKNWVMRKPAVIELLEEEHQFVGQRIRIRFSFKRVFHIVLTAELVRAGFKPSMASHSGFRFILADKAEQPGVIGRIPGELYKGIRTIFVGNLKDESGHFVPVTKEMTALEFLTLGLRSGPQNPKNSAFFLDVSLLYAQVCSTLRVKVDGGTLTILPPRDEEQVKQFWDAEG